jgi:hypothetical protein
MPINADNSPKIKWPLPEGKSAFLVNNVFSDSMLKDIKQGILDNADWGPDAANRGVNLTSRYCTIAGRWAAELPVSAEVWDHLEAFGKSAWGVESLRLKQVWFARYQKYKGVTPYLWEHMDQPGTQYTMDICIESPGVSWGLVVDEERFEEAENSALLFMGQQQAHSRPPYPSDDEDAYVIVMFALFVEPSHWMYDLDTSDPNNDDLWGNLIDKYKSDGDVRYYEHSGHTARFDNLPEGNYTCPPGECHQCMLVEDDFVDKIYGTQN